LKQLLQFDHQLPIGFLQMVAEVLFAGVNRFSAYLNMSRAIKKSNMKFNK